MTPRKPTRSTPARTRGVSESARTHRVRDQAASTTRDRSTLTVTTRSKVNLSLEVIRRREDGYHEIETILQCIDLADTMEVDLTDDARVTIECDVPEIPTDERNLCHRALVAMRPLAGPSLGARIRLRKHVPIGAGLGGGSANAAGVLLAVRHGLRLETPMPVLERIAASIGSDVPFFLHGGTMLGRGRGEVLTPLAPIKGGVFLIVKPPVSIPTAWVYSQGSLG